MQTNDTTSSPGYGRPALHLDKVTCTYPGSGGARPYTAVRDTSLVLQDGEFLAIVGPTGCGKSTLLNVAAGLIEAASGSVTVFGRQLRGLNRDAGYMFQMDALLPWLTARANVSLALELHGIARSEATQRADRWLERVGLRQHGMRYPHQLSGGMRKRVALAQTLILEPRILLMDEPFSALDVQTRQLMENELLEIWSSNRKSVAFVTHDLEEAIALADRVVVMSAGPETAPIGDFFVNISRPRDVTEVVHSKEFIQLHRTIWEALKQEVLTMYRRLNG